VSFTPPPCPFPIRRPLGKVSPAPSTPRGAKFLSAVAPDSVSLYGVEPPAQKSRDENSPFFAMVYLIGVHHLVQHDAPSVKIVREKRATFKAHVLEVIKKLDISVFAEEFNEEAKKNQGVSRTTLEQFGKAERIEYRSCDPTSIERKEKQIERSDWDKREKVWLSRINDCKNRNVLFVCGDDHFESFSKKLTAEGFAVEHAPKCWRISYDELFFSEP
jgi:hypothetical protein